METDLNTTEDEYASASLGIRYGSVYFPSENIILKVINVGCINDGFIFLLLFATDSVFCIYFVNKRRQWKLGSHMEIRGGVWTCSIESSLLAASETSQIFSACMSKSKEMIFSRVKSGLVGLMVQCSSVEISSQCLK